jgi:hypothetical protein
VLLPVVKHSLRSLDNADVQRSISDVTVQDPGPFSPATKVYNVQVEVEVLILANFIFLNT